MNFSVTASKYFSLGYLFLIIMGIVKEGITFYQMGINFLSYSSITDILLSPIVEITGSPIILIFLLFFFFLIYFLNRRVLKNREAKWVKYFVILKEEQLKMDDAEFKTFMTNQFVMTQAIYIILFFIGFGLAQGNILNKRIQNETFDYKTTIEFTDGTQLDSIAVIRAYSSNYLYVEKGKTKVSISPVTAIKKLD